MEESAREKRIRELAEMFEDLMKDVPLPWERPDGDGEGSRDAPGDAS